MEIVAHVRSSAATHDASVSTAGTAQAVAIPVRRGAPGAAVDGGELLMLALATCYCNDLYREGARLGIPIDAVEVEARADFEGAGLAATNVRYRARVASPAPAADVAALLEHTDAVAEVHNTLRAGAGVVRLEWDGIDGDGEAMPSSAGG